MHTTTDRMTRLLTATWNELHEAEKLEALAATRRLARKLAAKPNPPVWAADSWAYTLGDAIAETLGDEARALWNEASHPDQTERDHGVDVREAAFYAAAVEARLRHRPRQAARAMLRRAGQRTTSTRSRRLATA